MIVIFLKEYNDGVKLRRSGELANIPDAEARALIREGIAIERMEHGPEERKGSSGKGGSV